MKTLLIPTDFNASALDIIPGLCASQQKCELNIVFVHLFKLSDSISDLLMLSRRSREFEHVGEDFLLRCRELQQQYPQIRSFRIEFFYGSTLSMFRNFLESQEINCILHPELCSWKQLNTASIDPSGLISKCGIETLTLLPKPETRRPQSLPLLEEESLMAV